MTDDRDRSIAAFYDSFAEIQQKVSFNERHYMLERRLLRWGLSDTSNVLDVGCGIGVMINLIRKTVRHGRIIGLDISHRNIELARRLNPGPNIELIASNVATFRREGVTFDFITLFDVLEHIPINEHDRVFAMLASHMMSGTALVINIPNPAYLEYLIEHEPTKLQVVDQPLPANLILDTAYRHGLVLRYFETYDIWDVDQDQFMVFCKKQEYLLKSARTGSQRTVGASVRTRLRQLLRG